jgi:outer membrane murein-binding lipoprotein Lpp
MSTLFSQARTRIPRFADAAVERARLTVVPRARAHAPRTPFVVLVVLLLAGGVAGLLAFNTSMQQASFEVTALQSQADSLAGRQQSLSMDLERLRDPQRLARVAKRLGMVPPPNPAFVRLSDGKILGQPLAATPLDAMRINALPAVKPKVLAPPPKIVRVDAPKHKVKKNATKKTTHTDASSTQQSPGPGRKKHQHQHQGASR